MATNTSHDIVEDKVDFLYGEIRVLHKKIEILNDQHARAEANHDGLKVEMYRHMNPEKFEKQPKESKSAINAGIS